MTLEWRLFTTAAAYTWAIHLLLSTLPVVFMDALHLEAPVKRQIALTYRCVAPMDCLRSQG